jgi:hypothetical protein
MARVGQTSRIWSIFRTPNQVAPAPIVGWARTMVVGTGSVISGTTSLESLGAEDCAEDVSGVTNVQNNIRLGGSESSSGWSAGGTESST